MAEMTSRIMAMVEEALEKDPNVGSSDLFERVKERFPAAGDLSIRQFHARYPLQVKRRKSMSAGGASKPKSAPRRSLRGRKRAAASAEASSPTRRGRPRRRAAAEKAPQAAATSDARDRVRAILLAFATELASVEAKVDVVKVLAGTDRYVDQLISATDS